MTHCSCQCHYNERIPNAEAGRMEASEWWRDEELGMQRWVVTGVGEGCAAQGSMSLLSRANRVVCSSLQLYTPSPQHTAQAHGHPASE